MADNVEITAGSGTPVAADEISGVKHQRVKVQHGADGSATDVSTASPLPVDDADTQTALATLNAKDFATQTTLAAILAKILAAPSTEAKQDAANSLLTDIESAVDGLESKDYATQTTLAAILAKIIAAPATEAKQDTGNTSLAAILAAVDGLEVNTAGLATQTTLASILSDLQAKADLSETQPVSAASLPLPSGAATQATLASILTELGDKLDAGGEVALSAATLAALETIQVGSIAAGDNNIGNVDLASAIPAGTNNIGDVDVLTVPADPFGANADAAVAAGAVGSIQAKLRRLTTDLDAVKTAVQGATPAGTNNIGDVDVATQPARVATTDTITAKLATDRIMDGTTAITPVSAIIDAATSGDNTLLAAQGAGNAIRVFSLYLVAAGTTTVRFESGAGGTALSGQMNLVANVGFVLPFNPLGWFTTADNALLNLELSAAVSVDGGFVYGVV